MQTTILIKGSPIDLFSDENIELNSSVANTEDITQISSDYTKSFTVPATDKNNGLFKHYYNADIDNAFDSRTKVYGEIYIDGFLFKKGKFRLEKVSVKNHEPSSYTINFWGELINIKDLIKEDEIASLDLSALNFPFNGVTIAKKMSSIVLFDDLKIIFNLMVQRQLGYNDFSPTTEKFLNLKTTPVDISLLKPSVKVIELVKAIEAKYGVSFSRHFLDRQAITELYMFCNKDTSKEKKTKSAIHFAPHSDLFTVLTYFNDFTNKRTESYSLTLNVIGDYAVIMEIDGTEIYSQSGNGTSTHLKVFGGGSSGSLAFFIDTAVATSVTGVLTKTVNVYGSAAVVTTYNVSGSGDAGGLYNVSLNLPKIKIIDFLRGLFKMFKLVAIPQENGVIYLNTIDDFYRGGTVRDFTEYIDFESFDVARGTINQRINFKYQDPTTILNKRFKENTGQAYGDEALELSDDLGVPLDGDTLDVELPFEQVVYERISNKKIQYATLLDEKLDAVNPKPILFYNNLVSLSGGSSFKIKDGATEQLVNTLNTPSQTLGLEENAITTSLNWGREFSTWSGVAIEKTLFSEYWKNYILSIYNVKRRMFTFSAVLPTNVLLDLKLNDILYIKERYYRINDFTVNLITNKASLNLTNSFDNNFGLFTTKDKFLTVSKEAIEMKIYVSNSTGMNVSTQDVGFGVGWCIAIADGFFFEDEKQIKATISENTTGIDREVYINADNGAGQSFQILIEQKA